MAGTDISGARFCLPENQITRQLGLKQHHGRRRYLIPVLDYVEFHASDFHLASDARFYWSTGLLSGVLDNAPTYLTFLTAALSLDHFDLNRLQDVAEFASGHGSRLAAISVAATLFGGLTYIGNSPNLLIRAIAESRQRADAGISRLYY